MQFQTIMNPNFTFKTFILILILGGCVSASALWPVDIPGVKSDLDELTQITLGSFTFVK